MNYKNIIYNEILNSNGKDLLLFKSNIIYYDYIIICTSNSKKHSKYIKYNILKTINNKNSVYIEEDINSDWIILEINNIIVHIMRKFIRDLYLFEKLLNKN